MRKGDIGDAGIEHLHESGKHNRYGDKPWIHAWFNARVYIVLGWSPTIHAPLREKHPANIVWMIWTAPTVRYVSFALTVEL